MNKALEKILYLIAVAIIISVSQSALAAPDDMINFQSADAETVARDSTAAQFFVSAPLSVFPTIDSITRLDMIDYFQAGSDKPSRNAIGGECRILADEPQSITFTTSDVAEYTLSLLPTKPGKQPILMLVRTLKTPAEDSTAKFYTTDWKELTGLFVVPQLKDWLNDSGRKQRQDVQNAVPFVLARLDYSPLNRSLTLTNNVGDYLPEEALGLAKEALHTHLIFHWNGRKFVAVKQK